MDHSVDSAGYRLGTVGVACGVFTWIGPGADEMDSSRASDPAVLPGALVDRVRACHLELQHAGCGVAGLCDIGSCRRGVKDERPATERGKGLSVSAADVLQGTRSGEHTSGGKRVVGGKSEEHTSELQ